MERVWLKNYPPNVPFDLPPINQNLIQKFESACRDFKNKTAFTSFGQTLSYGELKKRAFDFAAYLQSQGFKKGDVIVIQLPNLLQYPIALWGAILAGLTVINMNPLYTASEMLKPIQETSAKGIILLSNNIDSLKKIIEKTKLRLIIVAEPGDLLNFSKKHVINFVFKYNNRILTQKPLKNSVSFLRALKEGSNTQVQIQERNFNEILLIQYTAGTTEVSKGVCLSQRHILSNLKQCELWMLSYLKKGEETALSALPFYHIFAFMVNGLVFFLNGFTNVLIANPRNMSSLIKTMKKQKISIGTGVNTLFKKLLLQDKFKKLDFSRWKLFIAGGMSLELSVQRAWKSITKSHLVEGYGLTEASPVVCCNRLDKPSEGFVGFPFPSTQIRIVDEKGEERAFNEEGQLELKGPQVMTHYYKKEEETKLVLNSDAWLKTGDIAKVNLKGLVQIIDRKKDMINISGLKVSPNEVEIVLLACEKVKEVAVVTGTNEMNDECIKAFVVQEGDSLTEKELKSHCKKHLAPYKIPQIIIFTKMIPKNFIGKPLRRLLKN